MCSSAFRETGIAFAGVVGVGCETGVAFAGVNGPVLGLWGRALASRVSNVSVSCRALASRVSCGYVRGLALVSWVVFFGLS